MSGVVTSLVFVSALCTWQEKENLDKCMSGRDLHWFPLKTIQVCNCANTEEKYDNDK